MAKNFTDHSTKESMLPLISPTDTVIVDKKKKLDLNDIVVFSKKGRLIAHRVVFVDLKRKTVITKGDNNQKVDGSIPERKILGKVEKIKREGDIIHLEHQYLSQSSSYLKEIKNIEKRFQEEGIKHVFLKGLPLHLHLSKKPPNRLYLDADLLIQKRQLKVAEKILGTSGFKKVEEKLYGRKVKNPTQINFYKDKEPYPVVIDLHLEPAVGFTKDRKLNRLGPSGQKLSSYLFSKVKEVEIDDSNVPLLEANALLIYLLLHFYHHNFNGPHRINLIAKLIESHEVNWKEVVKDTKYLGVENYIYPSTLAVNRLYKGIVPKKMLEEIRPTLFKAYLAKLIVVLINPLNEPKRQKERLKRLMFLTVFSDKSLGKRVEILLDRKNFKNLYFSIKSFFSRRSTNSS